MILQIWAYYNSLLILAAFFSIATLITYLIYFTDYGLNIMDIYLAILLLFSGATILITFTFGKKPTTMTAEVIRGERMLLYNTAFITFWQVSSRSVNLLRSYLISTGKPHKLFLNILYDINNLCGLFANPGALLVLYYLSSPLRNEFHQTFKSMLCFKIHKQIVGSLPSVLFTTSTVNQSRSRSLSN